MGVIIGDMVYCGDILATFENGRKIKYTTAIYGLLTMDKTVKKIETTDGTVLWKKEA